MWKRLKNLFGFGNDPKPITPDQIWDDDPVMREIVARAFNSEKPVIAHVDENGEIIFEELDN